MISVLCFSLSLWKTGTPLIKHLADRHIPPKVYWPVPPFVKVEDYPGAQYIYSHIMSVSCDERFNTDDMQKIVEAFENY